MVLVITDVSEERAASTFKLIHFVVIPQANKIDQTKAAAGETYAI
jgi:hypothetical protein